MNQYVFVLEEQIRAVIQGDFLMVTLRYQGEYRPESRQAAESCLRKWSNKIQKRVRVEHDGMNYRSGTQRRGDTYTHTVIMTTVPEELLEDSWEHGEMEILRMEPTRDGYRQAAIHLARCHKHALKIYRDREDMETCHFNDAIECDMVEDCGLCGWNPSVVDSRKRKIRRDMNVSV